MNGKDNGVWLPKEDYPGRVASLHRGRPTAAYTEEVIKELNDVTNRDEAIEALDRLRKRLESNDLSINSAS